MSAAWDTGTHKSVATADGAVVSWVFHRFRTGLTGTDSTAERMRSTWTTWPFDLLTSRCLWKIPWLRSNVPESGGVFCFLTLTFAKGDDTSKSSRYNATMRYASYSLHARLRFSRWMHELSSARFQSASWVKRRDFVRTFQKAAVFVLLTFWPFDLAVFLQTRCEIGGT